MAKAWRNEAAAKINARRASCEPTARVQKNMRQVQPSVPGGANFLLAGLLQRAGLWYPSERVDYVGPSTGGKSYLKRAWQWLRSITG